MYFPGLADHPGHDIAVRQMTGFGGMVSFELDGTPDEAAALASSFKYFALGESLGSVRSLVCLPSRMTHKSIPAETRAALGLSETLIRLSTGCESPRDLAGDVLSALDRLGARTPGGHRGGRLDQRSSGSFLNHDSAPDGQRSTCAVIVALSACSSSIHGRRRGSKTFGKPRAQIPECRHKSGFHTTVTSPLV